MAFRILSPEEIELLTDVQREAYEEELEIYRERAKFVEQIERFDCKKMTPYEPKLERIPTVKVAPNKEYSHVGCSASIHKAQICQIPELPPMNIQSANHVCISAGKALSIPDIAYDKPAATVVVDVPHCFALSTPEKTYTKPLEREVVLPEKVFVSIPEHTQIPVLATEAKLPPYGGLTVPTVPEILGNLVNKETIKQTITTEVLRAPETNFVAPKTAKSELPKYKGHTRSVKDYHPTELSPLTLPKTSYPKATNILYKPESIQIQELPPVAKPSCTEKDFIPCKVAANIQEVPKIEKTPAVNSPTILRMSVHLPEVFVPNAECRKYDSPKIDVKAVASVHSKNIEIPRKSYRMPDVPGPVIETPITHSVPSVELGPLSYNIDITASVEGSHIPEIPTAEIIRSLMQTLQT